MSCTPIAQKFGLMHNLAAEENEDEDSDTIASRFTAKILNWLISGFMAKDKNVRYRVLQTVAEMVSHLGEIEYVFNTFLLQATSILAVRMPTRLYVLRYLTE